MLLWQRDSLLQDGGTGCPPSSRDHLQSTADVSQPACQQFSLIVASPTLGARVRAERRRGYNQAELLARGLADIHGGLKVVGGLRKVRETSHQRGLGRRERRLNLKDSFRVDSWKCKVVDAGAVI